MEKVEIEDVLKEMEEAITGASRIPLSGKVLVDGDALLECIDKIYAMMPEEIKQKAIDEFGGLEKWHEHYIKAVSSDGMQRRYRKMLEWFGGKENYLATVNNPISKEVVSSYQKRMDAILEKLAGKRKCSVDSFEVKEIIGEYSFVIKQLYQLQDESGMMLSLAKTYRREEVKKATDEKYGNGVAQFFIQAIEAFYK